MMMMMKITNAVVELMCLAGGAARTKKKKQEARKGREQKLKFIQGFSLFYSSWTAVQISSRSIYVFAMCPAARCAAGSDCRPPRRRLSPVSFKAEPPITTSQSVSQTNDRKVWETRAKISQLIR